MNKFDELKDYIAREGKMAIAYSGGVDSTFLMAVAVDVLGAENVLGFYYSTPFTTRREEYEAKAIADQWGFPMATLRMEYDESDEIYENFTDRCYTCKNHIFREIIAEMKKLGFRRLYDGSNLDDSGEDRPGMQAVSELKVKSPLLELGFTKDEIRRYSKELYDLPTWNKPSETCLATRVPHDQVITPEMLEQIEEGEEILHGRGYFNCRLRHHGSLARIELLEKDILPFMEKDRLEVAEALMELGFSHVTVDLYGYKRGGANHGKEEK